MKKFTLSFYKSIILLLVAGLATVGCYEDLDDNLTPVSVDLEIKDFVWKALNAFYLYKDEIPDLANDRFSNSDEYTAYLNSFDSPEQLFESLIFMRNTVDRFSVLYDDFILAEQRSEGIEMRTGIRLTAFPDPQDAGRIHVLIVEVVKDSPADVAGVKRGMIFSTINGSTITTENFSDLIGNPSFTLGFGDYNDNGTETLADDTVVLNGEETTLTRALFTDKSINLAKVLDVDGRKIGYLVYNQFNINFESELNEAFGLFKNANVEDLIIDLRYNPGGQIITASRLASMITGQFNDQVFSKLIFNNDLQDANIDYKFTDQIDNGQAINSLGLEKVYVLTTGSSASASELLINSLGEYINVVHIGTQTAGKTQASRRFYDSPDFNREDRNPRHTYAIQPLIAISVDKNGGEVPGDGLAPDIVISEIPDTYQVFDFGNESERLLATALAEIRGSSRLRPTGIGRDVETMTDGRVDFGGLIIETNPKVIKRSDLNID